MSEFITILWTVIGLISGVIIGIGMSEGSVKLGYKLVNDAQNRLSRAEFIMKQVLEEQDKYSKKLEVNAMSALEKQVKILRKKYDEERAKLPNTHREN